MPCLLAGEVPRRDLSGISVDDTAKTSREHGRMPTFRYTCAKGRYEKPTARSRSRRPHCTKRSADQQCLVPRQRRLRTDGILRDRCETDAQVHGSACTPVERMKDAECVWVLNLIRSRNRPSKMQTIMYCQAEGGFQQRRLTQFPTTTVLHSDRRSTVKCPSTWLARLHTHPHTHTHG